MAVGVIRRVVAVDALATRSSLGGVRRWRITAVTALHSRSSPGMMGRDVREKGGQGGGSERRAYSLAPHSVRETEERLRSASRPSRRGWWLERAWTA